MIKKKLDKKIGVLTQVLGPKSLGLAYSYYNYFSQFGEVIMIHNNSSIQQDLDLLVLVGGPDIEQSLYKSHQDFYEYRVNNPPSGRGFFYRTLLPQYMDLGIPMFGICLGHQVLAITLANAFLEADMSYPHETNKTDEPGKIMHKVKITLPEFVHKRLNFNLISQNSLNLMGVNSRHHQMVKYFNTEKAVSIAHWYEKRISENKKFKNYKPVEALAYTNYPAYSVQWHPEDLKDDLSKLLIHDLLSMKEDD